MKIIRLISTYLFLFVFLGCTSKKNPPDSLAINLDDVEWGEPRDGSISPAGTRVALQSTNPNTGGISYYAWFPAGGFFDEHWHTHDFAEWYKGSCCHASEISFLS